MNHDDLLPEDAQTVADLLHRLLRYLTVADNDPMMELPLAQLRLCGALGGRPRPMSAIGRELGKSLSALTQVADRLERARLVKRMPQGGDRRVRCLQLTERGVRMMRRHEQTRVTRMAEVLSHLTSTEREDVTAALQKLVRASAASRSRDGDSTASAVRPATSKVLI